MMYGNSMIKNVKQLLDEAGIELIREDFKSSKDTGFFYWERLYPKFKGNCDLLAYLASMTFSQDVYKIKPEIYKDGSDLFFTTSWYFHKIPLSKIEYPLEMDQKAKEYLEKLWEKMWAVSVSYKNSYPIVSYFHCLSNAIVSNYYPETKKETIEFFSNKPFVDYLSEQWDNNLGVIELYNKIHDINSEIRALLFSYGSLSSYRKVFLEK